MWGIVVPLLLALGSCPPWFQGRQQRSLSEGTGAAEGQSLLTGVDFIGSGITDWFGSGGTLKIV